MKVKLNVDICGPEGNFKNGDVANLSDKLANALIQNLQAIEIKNKEEVIIKKVEEIAEIAEKIVETIKPTKKFGGKK